MSPRTYRHWLSHAEETAPVVVAAIALPVFYVFLRQQLVEILLTSFAAAAIAFGGKNWAQDQEKAMAELEYAQPGAVQLSKLDQFRVAHVLLAGLTNSAAVVMLIAIILIKVPSA